jgi:hypothetical protein
MTFLPVETNIDFEPSPCRQQDIPYPVNQGWIPAGIPLYDYGGLPNPRYPGGGPLQVQVTYSTTITIDRTACSYPIQTKTCDGDWYPQPCLHISSVVSRHPAYATLTCAVHLALGPRGAYPRAWYETHGNLPPYPFADWIPSLYKSPKHGVSWPTRCQVDEWPPYE